ncbi:MAG: hypothetical protein P0Y52_12895 [Candidatus Brevundimonas phytovorans]|nr:hypothetical protein [Brevundimonas sp.]WEK57425.1 MAG: hypothetical protein P0Y52_12895 [Brevundimonas sp.]
MWVLAGIGVVLGGLVLILREGWPLLEAQRTGVIRSKGYSARRIERSAEPERFEALCRTRRQAVGAGALAVLGGVFWTFMQIASAMAG